MESEFIQSIPARSITNEPNSASDLFNLFNIFNCVLKKIYIHMLTESRYHCHYYYFFFFFSESTSSHCVGCGGRIHDQWILRVAPNLEWHAACLKCAECQQFLDEHCTCFVRDGKTYCKRDYVR